MIIVRISLQRDFHLKRSQTIDNWLWIVSLPKRTAKLPTYSLWQILVVVLKKPPNPEPLTDLHGSHQTGRTDQLQIFRRHDGHTVAAQFRYGFWS